MKLFSSASLVLLVPLAAFAPSAGAAYGDCRDTHGEVVACGCDSSLPGYASCGTLAVACAPVTGGVATVDGVSTDQNAQWTLVLSLSGLGSASVGDDGPVWANSFTYGGNAASGRTFTASLYANGVFLASASIACL